MESLMISWILPVSQIMLNHLETEKSHLVISEKETLYFYKLTETGHMKKYSSYAQIDKYTCISN